MKKIGAGLILVSLCLFFFGAFSFKTDMEKEQKDLTVAVNDENSELYPDQVQDLYKNRYIFDSSVIGFGAVCLVVGGLLVRKHQ
ncbi:hypothetical protein P5G62_015315 [Neobacillus sp. 179-C4.2 HS]|uniref:Uncharacterized protein n=1 Tax=Neobacillus driksii TaxID=3035913 RepID=A0ABV4YUF5_9BACI|nr:hypothetical protein [Neobacillus sp. 179.-C4.2 HS]MDP5192746.1 hypothetical protein [Neobacillus sp. 179.-C4.2 HS]